MAVAGCFPKPSAKPAYTGGVDYVPASTPGMMFVIVHPNVLDPGRVEALKTRDQPGGGVAGPNSDYILLCDGRGVDGMRCAVASEAALARWSFTPHAERASSPITSAIGASPAAEPATPVALEGGAP